MVKCTKDNQNTRKKDFLISHWHSVDPDKKVVYIHLSLQGEINGAGFLPEALFSPLTGLLTGGQHTHTHSLRPIYIPILTHAFTELHTRFKVQCHFRV